MIVHVYLLNANRRPNIKTSYRASFRKMTFLLHENLYIQSHFLSKARISTILGIDEIRHVFNSRNFIGLKLNDQNLVYNCSVYVQHFVVLS